MTGTVWYHASMPTVLVYEDAGGALWLVPMIAGGWRQRRPYRHYRQALRPCGSVAEQRVQARTAGIPIDAPATSR